MQKIGHFAGTTHYIPDQRAKARAASSLEGNSWEPRTTILFILSVSLVLWAGIASLVWFVMGAV